MVRKETIC